MQKKRLFFDIETSPNIGLFWEAGFKKNIDAQSILKERAIICICYKWEGDKEVHSLTWNSQQCDKVMLTKFVKIANSAAELVGHNGDRFDLAWIRTRCAFHKIAMLPNYTTVDTLKVSRSKFKFNSNKLDYIAKYLGFGGKIKTEFNLWKEILLNKDAESLKKMVTYCKNDVVILEKVYKQLSPHIAIRSRMDGENGTCPECGGKHLRRARIYTSAANIKRISMQCQDCLRFHTKNDK